MKLNCIEVDHTSAGLSIRGRIAQKFSDIPSLLNRLKKNRIKEVFILSTCNRFAIYFLAENTQQVYNVIPALKLFAPFIKEYTSSQLSIRNFLETSAGLKSQLIGEYEILGQIKKHYQIAKGEGALGQNLDILIREGLSLGKEVRTRTKVSDHATSYAALAFNLIKEKFNDLGNLSVLIIGTGKMSELISNLLKPSVFDRVLIASHQFDRAVNFARYRDYVPIDMQDLDSLLPQVDVIVAGTHKEIDFSIEKFRETKCPRGQFRVNPLTTLIIDLGIPRNLNPGTFEGLNVDYVDLDTLIRSRYKNIVLREQEVPVVQHLIEKKLEFIIRSFRERKWDPVYKAYWNKLQGIKEKELDWLMPKLGDIDENQLKLIRKFSHKLIRQISSRPFKHMRESAHMSDHTALTFELIKNLHDMGDIRSCEILDIT